MENNKATELFHNGEDLAVKYLTNKGYFILCRNFRSRFGEIDIIAQDNNSLVFVEVKTRSKHSLKQAIMNISFTKRKRISLTAETYISQHPDNVKPRIRFDIIILLHYADTDTFSITHLEAAFLPEL